MVSLDKIYTRGGDAGETSMGDGSRRRKDDPRIAVIGDVDEVNAAIGVARLFTSSLHELAPIEAILARVQNDLFDVGADLCAPPRSDGRERLRVLDVQVDRLEADVDAMNEGLKPLDSFVLPGGGPAAAHLHVARTVCRRAERSAVSLAGTEGEQVGAPAIRYLNRLSDLLFVASRLCSDLTRVPEVEWVPGAGRSPLDR